MSKEITQRGCLEIISGPSDVLLEGQEHAGSKDVICGLPQES